MQSWNIMSLTVKNNELIDIFRKYVDVLYYEREDSNTVGSFVEKEEDVSERQPTKSRNQRRLTKAAKTVAPSDQPQKRHTKTYVLFLCQNQKRPPQNQLQLQVLLQMVHITARNLDVSN